MSQRGNKTIREIYDDYQYEALQLGFVMEDLSLADSRSAEALAPLLSRADKLEALIDLYAYLLASQGRSRI